jgi:uncharacterized protein YggE
MPVRAFLAFWIALGSLLLIGPAPAMAGESTVSGSGTVTLRPMPTRLRLQVQLRSYGKTAEAALKNLKTRREAAVAELTALKADAASIWFSIPQTAPAAPAVPVVYGVPIARPLVPVPVEPSAGSPPPATPPPVEVRPAPPSMKPQLPPLLVASTTLRAEWPLEKADPEQLAAAVTAIREKVKLADLTGGKATKGLSSEEQELLEEAQMGLTQPSSAPSWTPGPYSAMVGPQSPGGPVFVFVAVLSDTERKDALARAVAEAKKDAAELAEAAGMKLGAITSLGRNTNPYQYAWAAPTYYGPDDNGPSPLTRRSEFEAVAVSADSLEFSIAVSVSYQLLRGGAAP